jgi:predicted amidohydrolase
MGRTLDLRLCQVGYEAASIRHHVAKIKKLVSEHREADLIVFPELCLHGHPSVEKPEGFLFRRMKALYGGVSADLYRFVREVGARVIIGEMKRKGDLLYNVATYVDPRVTQHYVKTHVHWTEHFTPGRSLRVFDAPFGPVGVNICFDAAFPEVWRCVALLGPEVIVNVSAVPQGFPGRYVHRRMAGAALDNQVFVVYANRPGPRFSGGSAVFDPRGEAVAACGEREEVLAVSVDLDAVRAWREEEQIYTHRRPQLYRQVVRSARTPVGWREPAGWEPGVSGRGVA